jgi:hypothetical protein
MRESKIGQLIKEMDKIKAEEPDPSKRSFGKAIERVEYVEKMNQGDVIPEGYQESLNRLKNAQSTLTPILLEKYPEAKKIYDQAVRTNPVKRQKIFNNITQNYQLSQDEIKQVLGDQGYQNYLYDIGIVGGHLRKTFPGTAQIMGSNESMNTIPYYGLRASLLGQYVGEQTTPENISQRIQEYSQLTGNKKQTSLNSGSDTVMQRHL